MHLGPSEILSGMSVRIDFVARMMERYSECSCKMGLDNPASLFFFYFYFGHFSTCLFSRSTIDVQDLISRVNDDKEDDNLAHNLV